MIEHTHEPVPDQVKWRRLTTVTVEQMRCSACGGVNLHKRRSITPQRDGSAL